MTDKQPEALRLADEFDATKSYLGSKAAAELRLQHSQIEYLSGLVAEKNKMIAELQQQVLQMTHREWQGLTDDEILEEYRQSYGDDGNLTDVYFAHAIEAKLKEKNSA